MLKSSIEAISNEYSLMVKQKMILVVVVIIPVLVNFLIGAVLYNHQIRHIPMAVVDQDNSYLSRMIVQQFRENETFQIKYDLDSSDEIKPLMDDSKIRVGMIIPEGFSKDVTELKSPSVLMMYDGSHLSIASAAKSKATEILLTLKTGVLIKLLEGKMGLPADAAQKMAMDVKFSSRTLYNPTKSFMYFLSPGMGTAVVQTGIALMAAVAIREEEVSRRRRARLGQVVGKIVFYTVLGTLSILLCLLVQTQVFGIPFRGRVEEIILLSLTFAAAVSTFSIMISAWVRNEMICLIVNAVFFIPNTVMVGYTWPVISMPSAYQMVAKFYPFYHYADNLRDLCLKGSTAQPVATEVEWMIKFVLIAFAAAVLGIVRLKGAETEESEDKLFSRFKLGAGKVAQVEEGE